MINRLLYASERKKDLKTDGDGRISNGEYGLKLNIDLEIGPDRERNRERNRERKREEEKAYMYRY